ncbi:endonuclease/exonuclease/phosphatase family protein [Spirulina sp. CS-785/01]|uniref:endonuclease/exonuclease/phosphatase family protein n=1 Tax=Spirulina sp. CS-785/01 TaxID=3021716 RepID=UPI00232ED8F3|nr:endonuclease/exonuclease/phosphatase family protein [Spirulina sp. CS-785/01]MDB9312535.1 endonuclease/exonuclease/phosphatase family protein [Spirulina sp. CS-785/01]
MNLLKVMTFNIRGSCKEDGVNIWENRANLNVQTIQTYNPDLIGFQELQQGNLETYQDQLTGYDYSLGNAYNREGRKLYNAIFWKSEQFKLVKNGSFYLSETPKQWSTSWESARVRCANWAILEDLRNQFQFLHFNTHLDHLSVTARQEGIKLIIQQLANLRGDNTPVILTGDFNSYLRLADNKLQSVDGVYSLLINAEFKDIYLTVGNRDIPGQHTVHNFLGKGYGVEDQQEVHRIDWIMTLRGDRILTPKRCKIIEDAQPPLYPSDHYPVLAELEIEQ